MRAPFIKLVSCLLMFVMPCVVNAAIPEGFDNFAILNKGQGTSSLSPLLSYAKPAWGQAYSILEAVATTPIGENLLTYGAKVNVGSAYGDRDAYLLRYDLIFSSAMSFSLKWAHEDWKYISSSKDSFGLEYNYYLGISDKSGIYGSFGGYYRYLKQRWNDPWWSPFNYNTNDKEYYFSGVLGWKSPLGQKSFMTFDINTRDPWGYYGLDHVAWDFNFYIGDSKSPFLWRMNVGVRTSALFAGTLYPSIYYGGVGFIIH